MPASNPPDQTRAPSPFNRTVQHDAKRGAILSQAAKLFNLKGSRATTLRDIAQSLGLTKTSLYYYVKTKEDLIFQCYMASLEHHHRTLDRIEHEFSSPVERISAVIRRNFEYWAAAQEGRAPHQAVLLEIAGLKGPQREAVEQRYISMFKRLRSYLRDGVETGVFRTREPTSTTLAILGSMDWLFSWVHTLERDELATVAEQAVDLILHGLHSGLGEYTPAALPESALTALPLQGFNREEQNRLKQEAFYKTGTHFFNKKGFNGTSLDEIADHLNVSKGAFYYHIKNKEDLLISCYNRSLDITEQLQAIGRSASGSGLEQADLICRGTFRVQNTQDGPLIRYNSITALPMDKRHGILARTAAANQSFGECLQAGIEDGSIRPINTEIAQQLIAGATNASLEINLWRRIDDVDEAAVDYFDVFFNGLLARNTD